MFLRHALRLLLLSCFTIGATCTAADDPSAPRGRLPRTVVPTHYALSLRIDPKQESFDGEVRIQVRLIEATTRIWLHGKDLDIAQASYRPEGGAEVALEIVAADASGVLRADAGQTLAAGTGELRFKYRAPYGAKLKGTYKIKHEGESYVMTQMESTGARNSFPSFDEPSFKTHWDVELTVPTADTVVANTRSLATSKLSGGFKRVRFATTEALPTYLIAYAVGPWDIVTAKPVPANPQRKTPLPLRGVAVKGRGKELAYALQTTPAIVAALEDYFGSAFPFDKLDLLAAPDFSAGAMENAGLITFRDSLLLINEHSPTSVRQSYFEVNAHELAHQWFGDLVTMPWWDDIWLNEGFATWMESKITQRLRPEFHADRKRVQSSIYAMGSDALATARQIREPVADFTDIQSAFDGITYSKGAAVLSMFESYLGEERFRAAIRAHMRAHARGSATSDDLIAAIAAQSDEPAQIARAFRTFLEQPGEPFLAIEIKCEGNKSTLDVRQSRYLPLGSGAAAARTWGVPMCVHYADGTAIRKHCALLETERATVPLPAASCPAWVMPNADGAGYYRFALGSGAQRALDADFDRLNEREQRIDADALTAAFDNGSVRLDDYLAAVPRLTGASSRQVVMAPADTLGWLSDFRVGAEAERKAFRSFVGTHYGPVLRRVGLVERAGEDDEARLTRASVVAMMTDHAHDAAIRADLAARGRRLLGMDGQADPSAVSVDLRDNALRVLIQDGGKPEFDAVRARLQASTDAVERREYLKALASSVDPALQAEAMALALDPDVKPGEMFSVLFAPFRFPQTRATARDWLHAHADELMARLPTTQQQYLESIASYGACSEAEAAATEAFWGPRMKEVEGGPRQLAQDLESVRLCGMLKARYAGEDLLAALVQVSERHATAKRASP